ncbi:Thiamine-monophosphate kinase [Candidatus Terasakiella magnetica]|nr:Thiamine-monophosphate kinase [Candidatus Terasakiella magnetica]
MSGGKGGDTPDEFGLIAELFAPLAAGFPGALGLTDDAAFIPATPGFDTVATMDAIVAGVHFLSDDPPDLIARKLVRVNLSDLAAKGAVPKTVMLAAAFPQGVTQAWLRAFAAGLAEDLGHYDVALIGGDTVSTSGPLTLTLTALGMVEQGRGLLRSGARPGQDIWVSGWIGDGALGLKACQRQLTHLSLTAQDSLSNRYRLPRPRVELGPRLIGLAAAAMDVSDGLVQDLGHICRASGAGAVIEAEAVPLSAGAREALAADHSLLATILTGGDDYEILFTAWPEQDGALRSLSDSLALDLTRIGRMVDGASVSVVDGQGAAIPLACGGWRHFSGGDGAWSG